MAAKPLRKRIKNWLIFQLVRSLIKLVRVLPRRAAIKSFDRLGALAFLLIRKEREKTLRHLRLAFSAQQSEAAIYNLAKNTFRALGRNAAEALRLPQLRRDGFQQLIHFVGREHLDKALGRGRGALCITGHIGCWELMAMFIASHYPLAVVGAAIYDPRLDELLVREREQAGYRTFSRTASGTRQILRWFREGGVLGILIDQDTRVDGEFVDFFGQLAYTPAGPVVLAERTGVPIVPLAMRMNDDFTHTVEVRPEITLQKTGNARADRIANVAKCSKAVEAFIRAHPTQWVWMHERWKTKPQTLAEKQLATE
ncbi:lysophospholipid acyltransferase family protein [candidate division KSB1 bacterium]|nr:lysophospholipid acyltransferase family protein [candidate division KSB1 bacterium]